MHIRRFSRVTFTWSQPHAATSESWHGFIINNISSLKGNRKYSLVIKQDPQELQFWLLFPASRADQKTSIGQWRERESKRKTSYSSDQVFSVFQTYNKFTFGKAVPAPLNKHARTVCNKNVVQRDRYPERTESLIFILLQKTTLSFCDAAHAISEFILQDYTSVAKCTNVKGPNAHSGDGHDGLHAITSGTLAEGPYRC